MSDNDRLAALLHAEDCWPDCGNPKEVPAGTLFHRMAARLIAAGVTLAATPAPLRDTLANRHPEFAGSEPRDLATPAPLAPHPGEHHDYDMTCCRCGEPGYLFVGFHSPGETFRWSEAQPKEADR